MEIDYTIRYNFKRLYQMKGCKMEYLDVVDENDKLTGKTEERNKNFLELNEH